MMGFLNKMKEAGEMGKKTDWKLGINSVIITLEDDYIHLKGPAKEVQVFYNDIQKLENKTTAIEIKTITDKYQLMPKGLRGITAKVDDMYSQIVEKMNAQKAPQSAEAPINEGTETPSFCGNCGQPLSGENFCPKCGNEIRKI